jgi:glycosyltransferase involved in cell wall biosynthesis
MRIGIDARLLGYQSAGISTYTRCLVQALAQVDAQDEFVVLRSRSDDQPLVEAPNVAYRHLLTPPHNAWEQIFLPLELSLIELDLLHSPDFIPPFRYSRPSVITVHDLAFRIFPETVTGESHRYYDQIGRAVQHAAAIIAVSESTRRDLVERVGAPAERIRVVYEASDPTCRPMDRAAAMRIAREKLRVADNFILFVGTVEPRKNLVTLLRALTAHELSSVRLIMAGSRGWLSDGVFRVMRELMLSQRVMFLGHVTFQDIVTLYNAADLVVYPSLYEGFGLPVLEAMACGTPVVCSNTSSLPEVAGDAALLVDPRSVDQWVMAIDKVLGDRTLQAEMREKGLRRAAEFSWERAARETLAVYRQAVGR